MAETAALQVAQLLKESNLRLVLAESCTGGKAATLLTQVSGISQWFCGSAVTYREQTKQLWLNVPEKVLVELTAESQATSDAMALGVLDKTPEANLACSITGHLGPGVDSVRDGWVYLSLAAKDQGTASDSKPMIIARGSCRLKTQTRIERQSESAHWMLGQVVQCLMKIR